MPTAQMVSFEELKPGDYYIWSIHNEITGNLDQLLCRWRELKPTADGCAVKFDVFSVRADGVEIFQIVSASTMSRTEEEKSKSVALDTGLYAIGGRTKRETEIFLENRE